MGWFEVAGLIWLIVLAFWLIKGKSPESKRGRRVT